MSDQPIPAVLSIEEDEPGYRPDWHHIAFDLDIFVNGIEQTGVISYDCHAGTVKRYERDPNNQFIVTTWDEVSVETVTGTVEVRRKPK